MPIAYIALGANLPGPIGTPKQTLEEALNRLREFGELLVFSSLYASQPVGTVDQPTFLNAVAALRTTLGPHELLERLLEIEVAAGRERADSVPDGSRTLDLDLLLFGDYVVGTENLQLPHSRLAERAFVLVPIAEIAPELIHPKLLKTMSQLVQDLAEPTEELPIGTRYSNPGAS